MWLVTAVTVAALALCCLAQTASGSAPCVGFIPVGCIKYRDPDRTYCNSCGIREFGDAVTELCCNLHWTDGELLPSNLEGFHDVTVADAKAMLYHAPCESHMEQTVYFRQVQKATLMGINNSHSECNLLLTSVASNFGDLPGLLEVLLVQSNATRIHDSQSVRSLVLDRSNVTVISNMSVICEVFHKSECFAVENSYVGELQHLTVDGYALMINSAFGTIYNTTLVNSLINNVTVQSISALELQFLPGYHNLRNIEFKHIGKHGLYFGEYTDVVLSDIKISDCVAPCILMKTSFVTFTRLVINGNEVKHLDRTKFVDWIIDGSFAVNINSSTCNQTNTTVNCNLEMYSPTTIEFEPIFTKRLIRVYNHQDVRIDSNCFQHLWLQGVSGHLRSVPGYGVTTKQLHNSRCDVDERKLTVVDCHPLIFLHLDVLSSIFITKSTIQSLDIGSPLNSTTIMDSHIATIENMMTQGHAAWSNVYTYYISNLFVGHPALFVDTQVLARITNVTINHESKVTIMRNCVINYIPYRGLNIIRGDLHLENSSIIGLAEEAIDIEESGRLLISTELENYMVMKCLHPPGIRVYRRSQVVFQRPERTPPWLRDCVKIRTDKKQKPNFLEGSEPIINSNCVSDLDNTVFCDMKWSEREYLLGYTNDLDMYRNVQVKNVHKLHLGDHCFDEIQLQDIEKVFIRKVTHSCFYILNVINCTVDSVANNVYNLFAEMSKLDRIAPDIPLTSLSVHSADIYNLEVTLVGNSELNSVTVSNVKNVKVESSFVIRDSNIEVVHPNGFTVKKGSHLMLENCRIYLLSNNGFNIYGTLTMKNVTVAKVDNSSILNGRNSQLFLTDVHFAGNESIDVFGVSEGPDYNLDNVTVAGKLITVSEKLIVRKENLKSVNTTLDEFVDDVGKVVEDTGDDDHESDEPFQSHQPAGNTSPYVITVSVTLAAVVVLVGAAWCIIIKYKSQGLQCLSSNPMSLVESSESINEMSSPDYGGTSAGHSTTGFHETAGASSTTGPSTRTSEGDASLDFDSPERLSGSSAVVPTSLSPTSERVSRSNVSAPVTSTSPSTASNVDRPAGNVATTVSPQTRFLGETAKSILTLGKKMLSPGKPEQSTEAVNLPMSTLVSGAQDLSRPELLPAESPAQRPLETPHTFNTDKEWLIDDEE